MCRRNGAPASYQMDVVQQPLLRVLDLVLWAAFSGSERFFCHADDAWPSKRMLHKDKNQYSSGT